MFVKTMVDSSKGNGNITVIIANETGNGEECLILSAGAYRRMTKQLGYSLSVHDEVTEEIYDALHEYAEQTAAIREGARLLTAGDRSAKELAGKLTGKGFSREAAEYTVKFLTDRGYLSEESSCMRIAEAAVRSKHYGKRRVLEYLMSHGYDSTAAKNAAEAIPEEDYAAALACQMEKKYPNAADLTRPEQQKMIAAMMRQGFPAGEVLSYVKEKRK